jgi:glycerol-3-phosphate dehydrogenase subunit C
LKNLVVLRNRMPLLAWLGELFLGITAKRRLPQPAENGYVMQQALMKEVGQQVVLFVDTFSHHYDPQIAEAAVSVFQRAGYQVIIAAPDENTQEPQRPLCCGRSYLAHGLVEEARVEAERTLRVLQPYAEAGLTIVGLEPACLLAIRDDYRALHLGEVAEQVSAQAILFEEFIVREEKAGRFNLQLKPLPFTEKLLVHGHCHQKAVGAMKSMRRVLKMIPELEFELIEASCCGMGGSFGLESEHAEMAAAMGEESLLPTIRAAADSPLLANGFSCREQIVAGSGRKPQHLVELLHQAMQ